jgi:pimeloyl-ACP methyl ester carboxylesterase
VSLASDTLSPPSKLLLALELRSLGGYAQFWAMWPLLSRLVPRGDGHPVMVLPGLTTSDRAMHTLRSLLAARGYAVYGWAQGRNDGPRPGVEDALLDRLAMLSDRHGRKVSLVGWSLGGIYARQMAKLMPERVRSVVTLASPFNGDLRATNAWRIYERLSGCKIEPEGGHRGGALDEAPPVPSTAIFSRGDGICAWRLCRQEPSQTAESIEVRTSHCGLRFHAPTLFAIGDRLAQPEGRWTPFDRGRVGRAFFPDPFRD